MKLAIDVPDSQADCLKATVAAAHSLPLEKVDEECIADHVRFTLLKQMRATVQTTDRTAFVKTQVEAMKRDVPVDMGKYARSDAVEPAIT